MEQNSSERQIIEINGIKMEVNLRHAKRIDHFRVGDPVKVLVNETHSSEATICAGVIIGFENFSSLPTILVAYVAVGYMEGGLKIAHINEKSKNRYEIVPCDGDNLLAVSKHEVLSDFDREQVKAEQTLKEIEERRRFFLQRFGAYFTDAKPIKS